MEQDIQIAPLQPAAAFIHVMANCFQERHCPPLARADAIEMAVRVLGESEADLVPFNHPDFDWSIGSAVNLADAEIEHWEKAHEKDG